jgi:hypothetical protein
LDFHSLAHVISRTELAQFFYVSNSKVISERYAICRLQNAIAECNQHGAHPAFLSVEFYNLTKMKGKNEERMGKGKAKKKREGAATFFPAFR